jgi:hypothetical protein
MKSLMKLSKANGLDEEFKRTCWSCLMILKDKENDVRVLEGLKVGQLNALAKTSPQKDSSPFLKIFKQNSSIYSQMATKFSQTFLIDSINSNRKSESKAESITKFKPITNSAFSKTTATTATPTQTTKRAALKDELFVANQFKLNVPEYSNRKKYDLMRIVEDQVKFKTNFVFKISKV